MYRSVGTTITVKLTTQMNSPCDIWHDSERIIVFYNNNIVIDNTANYSSIQFSHVNTRLTIVISNITIDDAGVYMSQLRNEWVVMSSVVLVVTGKLLFLH